MTELLATLVVVGACLVVFGTGLYLVVDLILHSHRAMRAKNKHNKEGDG